MKEKTDFKPLFVAILLIIAGIFSPSNGVDDRSYKTPLELITTMIIVFTAGLAVYFILILVEKRKEASKENYQQGQEES